MNEARCLTFRNKPHVAIFGGGEGACGQRLDVHKPLQRDGGFNDSAAPVVMPNGVSMRHNFDEVSLLAQIGDDALTAIPSG